MLVAAGADPAVTTDDGVTLLMSAAGIDYRQGPREKLEPQVLEAVRLALAGGADEDAVDAEGADRPRIFKKHFGLLWSEFSKGGASANFQKWVFGLLCFFFQGAERPRIFKNRFLGCCGRNPHRQ